MIKTITKIVAGITAAAALLLTAGCKNQLDYVDDTTALNQMYIQGFKVTGLDASLNHATASLMVLENDKYVSIGTAEVAEYTNDEKTAGYESGTAFVKFKTPYKFDGDKLHTSKISLYLSVGANDYKIADPATGEMKAAELAVKTSPAGTSDADLAKSYVSVSILEGVAAYSFDSKAQAAVALPLYMCDFDISTAASASDLPDGVTLTATTKTGTNCKYTVKFKGLTENVGTKFVVAGASIGSTDANIGDNWNIMEKAGVKVSAVVTDKDLVKEVDSDGNIEFVFYGAKPSWASRQSPAIKIAAYNVDQDPWVCLLSAGGDNFFFPNYVADKDVVMEVDLATLSTSKWKKSDACYPEAIVYIDGIKVISAPVPHENEFGYFSDGDDADDRIMFVPENGWGKTCHKYAAGDISEKGNVGWVFDTPVEFKPMNSTFRIGARIVTPEEDGGFWDNQTGAYSGTYLTTDFMNKHLTLIIDCTGGSCNEYLLPTSIVDFEFEVTLNKLIVNKELADVELIGGFNGWADTGTIEGSISSGTTVFNISSIKPNKLGEIKIRSIGAWDGEYNIGGPSGNIVLPVYTKSGTVNLMVEYTSGGSASKVYLEYVD